MESHANERHARKVKKGTVVSNKMQKTVVVRVERTIRHPRYSKVMVQAKRYYAHDDSNTLQIGDVVEIMETRPLSKLKRWRVVGTEQKSS